MAAGAPAPRTTAPARSAPWRMATPASSRLSCRRPTCRCASRSFRCARIPAAPENSAAGLGFRKSYRMLRRCGLQTNLDRTKFPPWGVQGGKEAQPGRFTVVDGGHRSGARDREGERLSARSPAISSASRPAAAAAMAHRPSARSTLIQRDLDAGYVSVAAAQRDFGITVGTDGRVRR